MIDDTIAAISTPIGAAGIGIIRVSGKDSIGIVQKIFRSKSGKSLTDARNHSLLYGHIFDNDGNTIDEVLVSVMREPNSFTAEDVVEVNCHGGVVAVRKTLEAVLKSGARPAGPGEFSKRAFLNGRIDLVQAEAIIDLINAKTDRSMKVSVNQLEGTISRQIRELRDDIMEIMAYIEAGIDFPEHDIEDLSRAQIKDKSLSLLERVKAMIATANTGKIFREGLKTVIVGKPNVGKSSLMNALLKEKRAIVTDIPGTTRDVIEEVMSVRGIPLKIVDTAGIRETEDLVEKIGVEKTKQEFEEADLILFMLDATTGLTEEDFKILSIMGEKRTIALINKTDAARKLDPKQLEGKVETDNIIEISVLTGFGLDKLENKIERLVYSGVSSGQEDILVTNVRHKNALEKAAVNLKEVMAAISTELPTDCMAIDLKAAWESLGEITGETIDEDIADAIFSRFCIGK